MEREKFIVLAVVEDPELIFQIEKSLLPLNNLILAKNIMEARKKYENQKFDCIITDEDCLAEKTEAFVVDIRENEKYKSVRDKTPVLVLGNDAYLLSQRFLSYESVRFIEKNFSGDDLVSKISMLKADATKLDKNTKRILKDEILISEGGKNHDMFWVVSGQLSVQKVNTTTGEQVEIGQVQAGELVGEMSFLDNLPRSASVKAHTDCEVLVIPQHSFISLLEAQPKWFRSIMQTLSKRLRDANTQITKLKE